VDIYLANHFQDFEFLKLVNYLLASKSFCTGLLFDVLSWFVNVCFGDTMVVGQHLTLISVTVLN